VKVLHVINSLDSSFGGPTTVLYGMANHQCRTGHDVTVCTTNRGNPTSRVLDDIEIRAGLDKGVSLHSFETDLVSILISRDLRNWLTKHIAEFDIVHVHGLYRFPTTYAAYRARKEGVPYVIRPHGGLDPYLYSKSARSMAIKRLYERWFDLPNLQAAGAIHYTAEEERERAAFLKLCAPSFVVPNGIDWNRFETLPGRGAFRAAHKLWDAPLVLFLGRLHFKKGLDLLIPAFDSAKHAVQNTQLVIVGPENDDYGRKVRGWVEERGLTKVVHFVGHLDGSDVVQAYVDADVFVLPSYTENFGMTVVEAMACGLPVVISDQVNIHREVAESGGGLVTRCDVNEIAQALITLLKDRDRRSSMGEAGRRFVQQRYTWPEIVDALTHEYENVIKRTQQKNTESAKCN